MLSIHANEINNFHRSYDGFNPVDADVVADVIARLTERHPAVRALGKRAFAVGSLPTG